MSHRIVKGILPVLAALVIWAPGMAAAEPEQKAAQEFAALQGVDAQALTAVEMDAIHGALTGQDLWQALWDKSLLITDPVLQAKVQAFLTTYHDALVSFFNKILAFYR